MRCHHSKPDHQEKFHREYPNAAILPRDCKLTYSFSTSGRICCGLWLTRLLYLLPIPTTPQTKFEYYYYIEYGLNIHLCKQPAALYKLLYKQNKSDHNVFNGRHVLTCAFNLFHESMERAFGDLR